MWFAAKAKDCKLKFSHRPVITLGAFDGFHLGHQRIFSRMVEEAKKRKQPSLVFTFQEHPQRVLRQNTRLKPVLTSFPHRLSLFDDFGVDQCLALHFTPKLAQTSPEDFVEKVLVRELRVGAVVLGDDSRFGRERKGDITLMRELADKHGFDFIRVPTVKRGGLPVKSTRLRKVIAEGGLSEGRQLLGRRYSTWAQVESGAGRGRKMGFPTANLKVSSEILPPPGVYAVRVSVLKERQPLKKEPCQRVPRYQRSYWPGLLNLGFRPTFNDHPQLIPEVHLLGFEGNLYGKWVDVEWISKLRDEKTFANSKMLCNQIERDILRRKSMKD